MSVEKALKMRWRRVINELKKREWFDAYEIIVLLKWNGVEISYPTLLKYLRNGKIPSEMVKRSKGEGRRAKYLFRQDLIDYMIENFGGEK